VDNIFKWEFLDEPLYRWFILLVALSLFAGVWNQVLGYMKGGA
jgi:hypothetical protein